MLAAWHIRGWYVTHNIETPPWDSQQVWDIEVRTVPSLLVASVTVPGDEVNSPNNAFSQLAGFIFWDNQSQGKIEMTAPVTAKKVKNNQKIEMTAPVTAKSDGEMTEVSFVMPSKWTMDTLPIPNNSNITISETQPTKIAVRTFGGYATKNKIAKEKEKFVVSLTQNNISRSGEMTLAQYNDPLTPAWMRTNEWWVEVEWRNKR